MGKLVDIDWRTTAQEDSATEDIRFTFSIWHIPITGNETVQRKSDTSLRGRTPSRPVRNPTPVAWLPLLPLEKPTELSTAADVIQSGMSLPVPPADEEQPSVVPAPTRRLAVCSVEANEEALPAKKKQRMSLRSEAAGPAWITSEDGFAGQVAPAPQPGLPPATVIRKVRMRDVDIVEEFLVSVLTRTYSRSY